MLIAQQIKQYRTLNKWFQTPLGLFAAHEFAVNLESVEELVRGDTLVQLGNCGENVWLKKLHFDHQWIVSPFTVLHKAQIESKLNHLPLNRNSVDCVLVPLTLEPFNYSLSLIDEIDRVLNPMGFVVFMCINPWSLWGAAIKLGRLHCYREHQVKMRSPFTLNRMFIQRGYQQILLSNFCYIPPINNPKWITRLTFLDEIGKMLWPFPSGFYCYIAQKYQLITPNHLLRPVTKPMSDYQSPLQPVTLTPVE
ncbi:MAG: methyltransferase domain-containing protein [Legionella sp.]|uniref:methyltransferase domain-containing protein n=1 Tax=Legionella sp. TaxID=459 RepID=UPI0039E616A4